MLETKIDKFVKMAEKGPVTLKDASKAINWDVEKIEEVSRFLSSVGTLDLVYPVNFFSEPYITVKRKEEVKPEEMPNGKVLEKYPVNVDNVAGYVTIYFLRGEGRPFYHISLPKVGPYTKIFMNHLKEAIAENVPIQVEDISDPKRILMLKGKFYSETKRAIKMSLEGLSEKDYDVLAATLFHDMFGLGDIEVLMGDDWLEEVAINKAGDPIVVYHRKYGWMKTNLTIDKEEEVLTLASQISRKAGREINLMNPIVDAYLTTGDRVASTMFPISSKGNTITIRRFSRNPWTMIHFIDPKMGTVSKEVAAFLWLAMQYELNILVTGGTASGKTSMLNAICNFIPPHHRVITIEDTREINLPLYLDWNWVPLVTRGANPEGKGEVSMLDLMVASLRMRPDRIIVGEVRRRREAEALFEAMHTGHSVYSTIHADTAAQVIRRLVEPPIEIPETELEALHLIVTQYRDRTKNKRKNLEVAEIVPRGVAGSNAQANYIYRWRARTDEFSRIGEPTRVTEILNLHTGMTVREIDEDLSDKEKVLQWMLDNKLSSIQDVGRVLKAYYTRPDEIVGAAAKGLKPSRVLGD
ncbi:MAG: type II/IV secretion system ATPase subunit [Candidatus Diapherotrites archaeon]|nr:type II/IV secretion system ATPase subunit [Candidatus Diapherotrites archaeon]